MPVSGRAPRPPLAMPCSRHGPARTPRAHGPRSQRLRHAVGPLLARRVMRLRPRVMPSFLRTAAVLEKPVARAVASTAHGFRLFATHIPPTHHRVHAHAVRTPSASSNTPPLAFASQPAHGLRDDLTQNTLCSTPRCGAAIDQHLPSRVSAGCRCPTLKQTSLASRVREAGSRVTTAFAS